MMFFSLVGCTQTSDCTIRLDGTVSVVSEMLLTQEEYDQLTSMGGEPSTEAGTTISDVTENGINYKKITETKTYKSISEFKSDMMSSFDSEISAKELWFILNSDETSSSTEYGPITTNLIFTMPYKISQTNGEKTSDYTVKFNDVSSQVCYYVTTEASTSEWTKSTNIENAIKNLLLSKIEVANFKFSLNLNSNLSKVTLKNNSGYAVVNGKNYFENNKKLSYIEIYRKTNNGNYVKIATKNVEKSPIKDIIYTDKTVKPNKKYTYKIRGVYKEGSFTKYSSYSSAKTITIKPVAPKLTAKSTSNKAKLSWNKVSGATGYQIYRSTKKKSGYKKIKTIKKVSTTSFINKKLKSKRTYYYKIRAYKTINGKKVYSSYSSIKTIKIV